MKKLSMLLCLMVLSILTAKAQSLPIEAGLPFKIIDTRTGEQITITALSDRMNKTNVLFWGEEHNDTIGHILELKLLKLLSERFRDKLTLSMEMFETDQQVILDEYFAGFMSKEKFLKEARLWNNYADYSPLVEFAREQKMPIVAANSPRRYNSLMSQRGPKSLDSLNNVSKSFIAKLPIYIPVKGNYHSKFVSIMGGEDNIHSPNMFASQCLWDATMAQSIDRAYSNSKKGGLIMHICGRFNFENKLCTVKQILHHNKEIQVSTISCFPADDFEKPDVKSYSDVADFIILIKKSGN
jgi:uncharacterized iron-regulated protein